MTIHPELRWQLAQAKIDEARSGSQHAPALRAAELEQQAATGPDGARRAVSLPATLARSRFVPRRLQATPRGTAKG